MALSLSSISREARIRAPRILLYGVEKIGKTECACGSRFERVGDKYVRVEQGVNKPILLPIKGEEGADQLDVPTFWADPDKRRPLGSLAEVIEALCVIYESADELGCKTVVIDSVSTLEHLVWDAVCAKWSVEAMEQVLGGFGKGYDEAVILWRELTAALDALRNDKGMAIVLIGHAKVKRFNDPCGDSYDEYQLDLQDKASALIRRWVDGTFFANTKVAVMKEDKGFGKEKARGIDVTGGRRFLFTQKRPAHQGGGRGVYGQLPYELPLDWTAFEAAVAGAMSSTTTAQGAEA